MTRARTLAALLAVSLALSGCEVFRALKDFGADFTEIEQEESST